jgi:NADH:ubiquinone oxidoreductase subunit 4 (subunit M)
VIPFFPAASAQFADIAIIFGLIGIFYGAWCAFQQTDMKRLLAYTSISHMGFVLLAIYAGNILTFQGLMIMMLAHGLSSALFNCIFRIVINKKEAKKPLCFKIQRLIFARLNSESTLT